MTLIDDFKSTIRRLSITDDAADDAQMRLAPDGIRLYYTDQLGNRVTYRQRHISALYDVLTLDRLSGDTRHVYYASHDDTAERLILCANELDAVILQRHARLHDISAQCVYVTAQTVGQLVTAARNIIYDKQLDSSIIDQITRYETLSAIRHNLDTTRQYILDGHSLRQALQIRHKPQPRQQDTTDLQQWLTTLPRSVYTITELHDLYRRDSKSTLSKQALGRQLQQLDTTRRCIHEYVPAIAYRSVATQRVLHCYAIRDTGKWTRYNTAQWLDELRRRT